MATRKSAKKSAKKAAKKTAAKKASPKKRIVKKAAKKAAAKKGAAKKVARKPVAVKKVAKKSAVKKPVAKKAAAKKVVAKKAVKKAVAKKPVAKKARKPAPAPSPEFDFASHITPEQALENTRKLLADKQEHDRQAPLWQSIGHDGSQSAQHGGFQSDEARDRAVGRQQEELRSQGNAGSSAAGDRHAQGKRDNRD